MPVALQGSGLTVGLLISCASPKSGLCPRQVTLRKATCVTLCTALKHAAARPRSPQGAAIETALRLIVAPKLASMDTRDALPAQLRQFASRVKLPTSALQVRGNCEQGTSEARC